MKVCRAQGEHFICPKYMSRLLILSDVWVRNICNTGRKGNMEYLFHGAASPEDLTGLAAKPRHGVAQPTRGTHSRPRAPGPDRGARERWPLAFVPSAGESEDSTRSLSSLAEGGRDQQWLSPAFSSTLQESDNTQKRPRGSCLKITDKHACVTFCVDTTFALFKSTWKHLICKTTW